MIPDYYVYLKFICYLIRLHRFSLIILSFGRFQYTLFTILYPTAKTTITTNYY